MRKIEMSQENELVVTATKKYRATPAARAYAREKGIDLSLVRGSGERGRVSLADVKSYRQHDEVKISPLAKRIAEAEMINLQVIKGSGPKGKIMKVDVLRVMNQKDNEVAPQVQQAAESMQITPVPAQTEQDKLRNRWGELEHIPMSAMRKVIAKRMSESYFTVPAFIVSVDVDMTNLLQFRKQTMADLMSKTGRKASVTDYINFALIKALAVHPYVNSSLIDEGKTIELHKYVNLGIAVGMDNGLVVPVVKGADKMSLSELVVASKEMTTKAQSGKLKPEEMAESTFTISNLGMFGVSNFVPIINQPNCAILAVAATVEKPVVMDGEICIRPMMTITLTADHRVIDGMEGAKFMQTLKSNLENPLSLLI